MPSRIVCFVCGSLGGEYQLHSKPQEGQAYFPFLEHHDPPKGSRIPGADGVVDSCRVCYAFLTQQWDSYERTSTPILKRVYWLKRLDDGQFTGAEMKLQGEYMAQVMGLQYQPSCGDSCAPMSPDSRDEFTSGHKESEFRKQHCEDSALDLSVPVKMEPILKMNKSNKDKCSVSTSRVTSPDQQSFICYTCGNETQGMASKLISSIFHVPNKPYFPFLTKLSRPKGAAPITEHGGCQVCENCFSSLCHQWLTYEQQGTPNSARIFKLNGVFFSNDSSIIAGRDVKVSPKEVCYLCSHTSPSSKMCPLYTVPLSGKKDHMYFPFIRELKRPHGAHPLNPDGSVLVCLNCYSNLQMQWNYFEAEKVPFFHRRYSLLPSSSISVSGLSMTSEVEMELKNHDLEDIQKHNAISSTKDPVKSPFILKTLNHSIINSETKAYSDIKLPVSSSGLSIPHPLQQASERPKKVCFVCGEKFLVSKAQLLHSYPIEQKAKSLGGQVHPFFPFLATCDPAPGSDPPSEEGIVMSCSYCFYSLLNQWKDYEELKISSDSDRYRRKYKLHEFVCFVCGMMVPRKKLRTLEVQKFLFLREHKAPANALLMWGGQAVGACSSCHFSLTHQYTEFERLGLPMELRKYNWTVQHHVEESKNTHSKHPGQDLTTFLSVDENNVAESSESCSSLSTTSKLTLTPSSGTRLPMSASSTFLSPNASTSGLSSFSAALRKLACQTKDTPDDSPVKHSMSPLSHISSRSTTPKRSNSLPLSSSKSNNLSASGQAHNIIEASHHADRNVTRNHTSPSDCDIKMASDKLLGHQTRDSKEDTRSLHSKDGGRATMRDSRSRDLERDPHISARLPGSDLYFRDYPSYWTEEEALRLGVAMSPLRIDPTGYMAAYHPFYLQQPSMFAHSPFRLDDPLLLEQYRMLQSSFLPFPGTGYPVPGHLQSVDMLAAQHYPLELLQQHYSFINSSNPMMTSRLPSHLSHRTIDEEKIRLAAEKSKEHERLFEWEVKHEAKHLSPEKDYKKMSSSDHIVQDKLMKESRSHSDSNTVLSSNVSTANKHTYNYSEEAKKENLSLQNVIQHHNTSPSVPLSCADCPRQHLSKDFNYTCTEPESHSLAKIPKLSSTDLNNTVSRNNLKTIPGYLHQLPTSYIGLNLSNNHVKTASCSSDSKTLFRPFDDKTTDSINDSFSSATSLPHGTPKCSQKSSDNIPAILSIPSIKSLSYSGHTDTTVPSGVIEIPLGLLKPNPLSGYVRDKVERFDFRSLAQECSSSADLATSSHQTLSQHVQVQETKKSLDTECNEAVKEKSNFEEVSPKKLELLEYLGITTWVKKKALLKDKEKKSQQRMEKYVNSILDESADPFKWPGVETVIESYHKYNQEFLKEKQLLGEHCQLLQAENTILNQASEMYSRHVASLLAEHQKLEQTKQHYLNSIEHLKKCCIDLK